MSPASPLDRPLSEPARLSAVFLEPKKAFADIAARPRFWVPIVLLSLVALAYTYLASQRIGWERVIRDALEKNERTRNMPAEQKERIIEQQAKFTGYIAIGSAAVAPAVLVLIASGVYLLVFRVFLGAEIVYWQVIAVYSYSSLPSVVSTLLAMLVMQLKPPEEFEIQNPLAFNLGAFLGEDAPLWLVALSSSLDLFMFWVLALLIVGMRVLAPRLSAGNVAAAVLAPWLLWVVVKTAWTAIFT